jgi:hypothetical protein
MRIGILAICLLAFAVVFLFCWKKSGSPSSGPWYSFLTDAERKQFEADVVGYFAQKGAEYKINFAEGFVQRDSNQSYGLENVAQVYHQASVEEKSNVVSEHFDKLFQAEKEEAELIKNLGSFEAMKKYVAVRLYSIDYAKQIGEAGLVCRRDIDSSITVLVLDFPSSVRSLKPEEIVPWKVPVDSLFSLGVDNATSNYKVDVAEQSLSSSVSVWLLASDDVFASTHVLRLASYPQCIGKNGALVLVPHRHAVIAYPINDLTVLEATKLLIPLGLKLYEEGPGSITPSLTWYHDGKFTNLPFKVTKKSLDFTPPDDFVAMLNSLGEAKK